MKIILWPLHYLPMIGGAEVQVHALAVALQKLGHQILVITNHPLGQTESGDYEGVPVVKIPFLKALLDRNLSQIGHIIAQVKKLVKTFQPDLIHIHSILQTMSFYQIRICQNLQIPICLTIHGGVTELQEYQKGNCQILCSMATIISTPSKSFLQTLDLKHPNLQVIENGLPIPTMALQPPPKHLVLVMVGRLVQEKGFALAFQAIAQIATKIANLQAILVGDGPEYPELANLRKELHLEHVIRFTGQIPNGQVTKYLDQASIVLIPSLHESFCLVALEAAWRARPVIASNISGLQEVVQHGETGLLIPPGQIDSIVQAIKYYMTHPEQITLMGNAALDRISLRFSIEKTADQYVNMYKESTYATSC